MSETAVTTDPMHCAAASDDAATRPCDYCLQPFAPAGRQRKRMRFCSVSCRNEHHAKKLERGTTVRVSKVSVLKGGALSVVIRFLPLQRNEFIDMAPGSILQVRKP